MRRTISFTALLATLLALALSATAGAATSDQIYDDCGDTADGYLKGSYTRAELRRALREMNGDVAEYTNCYDAIRFALSKRSRSSGGGDTDGGDTNNGGGATNDGGTDGGAIGGTDDGGTSGSTDPEDEVIPGGGPTDVVRAQTPQPGSNAPVNVGGQPITPGSIPEISRSGNELPSAMVIFLILLGAGAVGAAAATIGRRVLARRRV